MVPASRVRTRDGDGGLRRGEVVGLNVGDFSPAAATLHVLGKGNKERVIPLPKAAQKVLRAYLASRASHSGRLTGPPRRA